MVKSGPALATGTFLLVVSAEVSAQVEVPEVTLVQISSMLTI